MIQDISTTPVHTSCSEALDQCIMDATEYFLCVFIWLQFHVLCGGYIVFLVLAGTCSCIGLFLFVEKKLKVGWVQKGTDL